MKRSMMIVGVLTLLTGNVVQGDVIAEHAPTGTIANGNPDLVFADNFTPANTSTVGSIGFWLASTSNLVGNVFLLEDDGAGLPGATLLAEATSGLSSTVTNPDPGFAGLQFVEFDITSFGITLNAGTQYFIGVQGALFDDAVSGGWGKSTAGDNVYFINDPGFAWISNNDVFLPGLDFAFQINSAACLADFNSSGGGGPDGQVGIDEFLAVLADWGCTGSCAADISGPADVPDGLVGIADFLSVLANWGACP